MTNYTDYPFTYQGWNFISRITNDSPFRKTVESLPDGVFSKMNIDALSELLPAKIYTLAEIQNRLDEINEGATHAFILLEGESN